MDMPLPEPAFLDASVRITDPRSTVPQAHIIGLATFTADQLHARDAQWRAIVAAEVAKEREECAALCDRFAARDMHPAECAAAIRKGDKP